MNTNSTTNTQKASAPETRKNEMNTEEITTSDILDVRDIITRFEELEEVCRPNDEIDGDPTPEEEEREKLRTLLDELAGNGGDEQWNGVWYPVTPSASRILRTTRETWQMILAQSTATQTGRTTASTGNEPPTN